LGPIPALFYGKDDTTGPEGWIHNLEHGAMVVLYRCPEGCGTDAQTSLAGLQQQLPASPLCGFPPGSNVVVTRFDQLPTPYAAVVWGRVFFLDTLDVGSITNFYGQSADRAPEPQCQQSVPGYTPGPGPSASPAASGGATGIVLELTASGIQFDRAELTAPAGVPFQIRFANNDAGIPHNVAIHKGSPTGEVVWEGEIFNGVDTRTYDVPALPAGTYGFVCTVHPNMTGTLTVK
jgi:plastocyanin